MRATGHKPTRAGALAGARSRTAALWPRMAFGRLFAEALELEWEARRFFLWLPVLGGTGVLLYLAADHEPVLWLPGVLVAGLIVLARRLRHRRAAFMSTVALAAVLAGFLSAGLRSLRVGGPVLDRVRIVKLTGYVEEVDHRRRGSRFVVRLISAGDMAPDHRPDRVRLTTRRDDPVEAGDVVAVTARLLPPSPAALPGGYSFARDAYFAGFGAVGSVLGAIRAATPPGPPSWGLAAAMAIDRARNTLAHRVDAILGGDTGAIGAAMVTGKRDLLSDDGRELIREAGIFHIITIAGVQMTLVAGLLFGLTRRALALSPTLALRYPIKKWAALVALVGAIGYDLLTGSRIGTQRALFMTLMMLGAVLVDRRGFTMRNLALAALAVLIAEPESITGASFQLSFAAVAALIAVYEARERRREQAARAGEGRPPAQAGLEGIWGWPARALIHLRDLLVATACATGATASFMAANFHELSPYVFVGNPLTLGIIEIFAVPGALLGCVLYPFGLDGPVWHWVGAGIGLVTAMARIIAAAPGSTLDLPSFAPWALPFLTLAVLSAVIWRSVPFRLTAIPLAAIGLLGTSLGPHYDMLVAGSGDAVAVRGADGLFALAGRMNPFASEQWLRADGDGRAAAALGAPAARLGRCDRMACIVPLPQGQTLSLVTDARAFEEDCQRVDVIVTPLIAPGSCGAALILDRQSLAGTGALGLTLRNGGWVSDTARSPADDRPWSPAPPTIVRHRPPPQTVHPATAEDEAEPPQEGESDPPPAMP